MFYIATTFLTYLGTFIFWLPLILFLQYLYVRYQQEYQLAFSSSSFNLLNSSCNIELPTNDFYSQVKDLFNNPEYEPEPLAEV